MKHILVVQGAKLGDMVCTTPVFRAIKNQFPNVTLSVAGNSINKEVLRGNPHIDHYIIINDLSTGNLRDIDTAVLLNADGDRLFALLRARIPNVIVPRVVGGFSPYMTKKFRFLSLFAIRVPHRMGHYAPQEYLNMLRPLGIETSDTRKELFVETEAEESVSRMLAPYQGRLLVALAPGAGNKIKEWPTDRFNEVAAHMAHARDAVIVLVGGSEDVKLAATAASGIPERNILDTTGKLSIGELKALVKRMKLFVGVDTGPVYVAEAFGVPTVDIVGPMDEREQPPRGPMHKIVVSPYRKAPELHIMNARAYDEAEARKQVEDITSGQVIREIESLNI